MLKRTAKKEIYKDIFVKIVRYILLPKKRKNYPKEIFKKYIWHKQTLNELAIEYAKSKKWIKYTLEKYEVIIKQKQPHKMVTIIDSTFFGKRINQFGVAVIIDAHKKESVL